MKQEFFHHIANKRKCNPPRLASATSSMQRSMDMRDVDRANEGEEEEFDVEWE